LVDWFLSHQMADGGWNCEWVNGSIRSSFHSTLNVLKGLLDYERATGDRERTRASRQAAEEYLLARRLLYRASTGGLVAPWAGQFAYPFRWRYSALNAVDYFRAASLHDGKPPDERMADAVEIVRAARQADGTWLQGAPLPGRVWFEVDAAAGRPSKWLTFHALRVLEWWDGRGLTR
jgi:hypothetical protein